MCTPLERRGCCEREHARFGVTRFTRMEEQGSARRTEDLILPMMPSMKEGDLLIRLIALYSAIIAFVTSASLASRTSSAPGRSSA